MVTAARYCVSIRWRIWLMRWNPIRVMISNPPQNSSELPSSTAIHSRGLELKIDERIGLIPRKQHDQCQRREPERRAQTQRTPLEGVLLACPLDEHVDEEERQREQEQNLERRRVLGLPGPVANTTEELDRIRHRCSSEED